METLAQWTNSTGLVYFEDVMRDEAVKDYWDWQAIYGAPSKTDHYQKKGYLFSGFGLPFVRKALEPIKSDDMKEIGSWTVTSFELALGVDFDLRMMEQLRQKGLSNEQQFVGKIGTSFGESFGQAKCIYASSIWTNAFDASAQPLWDGLALCDSHVLDDGSATVDNDLPVASVSSDSIWDKVEFITWNQKNYRGLTKRGTPKIYMCSPSNESLIWQIANQKYTPGESSSINDENSLKAKGLKFVFNPDLGSKESFLLGSRAKDNLIFAIEKGLTTEYEDHKRNRSRSALAHMILMVGVKHYIDIVGSPQT